MGRRSVKQQELNDLPFWLSAWARLDDEQLDWGAISI